jgi:hypothetical protein
VLEIAGDAVHVPRETERVSPLTLTPETVGPGTEYVGTRVTADVDLVNIGVLVWLLAVTLANKCLPKYAPMLMLITLLKATWLGDAWFVVDPLPS